MIEMMFKERRTEGRRRVGMNTEIHQVALHQARHWWSQTSGTVSCTDSRKDANEGEQERSL